MPTMKSIKDGTIHEENEHCADANCLPVVVVPLTDAAAMHLDEIQDGVVQEFLPDWFHETEGMDAEQATKVMRETLKRYREEWS